MKERPDPAVECEADHRIELILVACERHYPVAHGNRVRYVGIERRLALRDGPNKTEVNLWAGVAPADGGDAPFVWVRHRL